MHPCKVLKKCTLLSFQKIWLLKYLVFINGKCDRAVKLLKLSAPAAAFWHSTLLGEVCQLCQGGNLTWHCTALCNLCGLRFKVRPQWSVPTGHVLHCTLQVQTVRSMCMLKFSLNMHMKKLHSTLLAGWSQLCQGGNFTCTVLCKCNLCDLNFEVQFEQFELHTAVQWIELGSGCEQLATCNPHYCSVTSLVYLNALNQITLVKFVSRKQCSILTAQHFTALLSVKCEVCVKGATCAASQGVKRVLFNFLPFTFFLNKLLTSSW